MSTLDELRSTLRDHSHEVDALHALDATTRRDQVRGRVRAVRRRRAAAVAGAVAACVAAVAALSVMPADRSPEPTGPVEVPEQLAGHDVPRTIEAAGWTYEYERSVVGTDRVDVELMASDEPRLVAWATAAPADRHRWQVTQPDGARYRATATDFSHYWRASPGVEGRVRLTGVGEAALAVYRLSGERPPGVTVEGLTFRETVAGDRLVAAGAARGVSSLTMSVPIPDGTLRFGTLCSGVDAAVQVELLLDGEPVVTKGSCDGDPWFDPGAGRSVSWPDGLETDDGTNLSPGDVVEAEVRLVGRDGEPLEVDDDTLLAASFYELAEPLPFEVAGHPVPRVLERDGVTWSFDQARESKPGEPFEPFEMEGDGPALVTVPFSGVPEGSTVQVTVDGVQVGAQMGAGSGTIGGMLVPEGGTVDVVVDGDTGPRTRLGVVVHTRFVASETGL